MDQRQKDLLNSKAAELADVLDFDTLATLLQLTKLVTEQKVEDIVVSLKI